MNKSIILALLVSLALTFSFPVYKQCDSKWANEQLGTSSNTICSAGCLMSSASMALSGAGSAQFTPSTLNRWLTTNNGYVSGDLFIWASINKFGLTFKGFISNSQIKSNLDSGNIVILNVHNGGHWVLAKSYDGDTIFVNDPGFSVSTYTLG
jgi:ABC-type bacteriocin/lantibiotic exporter with double-glycine peptidase domain